MKTAIVIDSSCYLTKEYVEKHNLFVVPLTINFENLSYREGVEDEETAKEIFDKIKAQKIIPTTSQPAGDEFLSCFENLKADGYERIIVLTITKNLSGTIQGATAMASMFMEENEGINIEVYDSKNVAHGSAIVVRELVYRLENDLDISKEKINEIIDFYEENIKIFLVVDSLDFLSYGGRISASVAALGNLFGIKPLLSIYGGVIDEHSKCRSKKKAFNEIVELFKNDVENNVDDEFIVTSAHALNAKEASKLLKIVENSTDREVEVLAPLALGPVISMHVGPESVGVGWSKKYKG